LITVHMLSLPFVQLISTSPWSVKGPGMGLNLIPQMSTRRGTFGCFSWNSSQLFATMLSSGSQVHSVGFEYPSYLTKYLSFPLKSFESMISSTIYSSPSSVIMGGGSGGCFCDGYSVGVKGVRYTLLKMGWILFQVAGSLSL
jgi:hypothetical protein